MLHASRGIRSSRHIDRSRHDLALNQFSRVFSTSSNSTSPSKSSEPFIPPSKFFLSDDQSKSELQKTVDDGSSYIVKLSPQSEAQLREKELQEELERRYPENSWVSDPDSLFLIDRSTKSKVK